MKLKYLLVEAESQADGKEDAYKMLRPVNEKLAIQWLMRLHGLWKFSFR